MTRIPARPVTIHEGPPQGLNRIVLIDPTLGESTRFAAGSAGNHVFVVSQDDDPSVADIGSDGAPTNWRSFDGRRDFDLVAASNGDSVYFAGGENDGTAVSIAAFGANGAASATVNLLPDRLAQAAAATAAGRVYLVSGTLDTRVVSATFSTEGFVGLRDETPLPRGRVGHVAVVF